MQHTRTHLYTHIHAHTHTLIHTYTQYTHTHTYIHTRTRTHTHTHAHTKTHTHSHTDTCVTILKFRPLNGDLKHQVLKWVINRNGKGTWRNPVPDGYCVYVFIVVLMIIISFKSVKMF
jgi:ribosomal protein S17